ncbi:tryptophan 7-halogenase [Erythrobacter sp.]|uniref:tryptophan 7-halogenase n=1 Tax=Erythrobacter sp. TaxID=1042 RepID=UPI001B18AFF0|nr:tryptophan 7-halogenase [Erythrobacter sp.]MBO6526851.1 tryptophan 7-halogenase [Erythrobacter sp.]MBO6528524.1 tryptophan 7-halogenase [Erythrobacter sp.]
MTPGLQSYAVIGPRADVWPICALLARQLPGDIAITVLEQEGRADEMTAIPVGDPLFAALRLDAVDLVSAGAGLALGYRLEGFMGEGPAIIATPSGDLPAIGGLAIHHILHRVAGEARVLDRFAELREGFRFCARAAGEGRLALPEDAPDSPLAMLGPIAVIGREALAELLEATIASGRVSKIVGAAANAAADGIDAIAADFVIDCRAGTPDGGIIDLPLLDAASFGADLRMDGMPVYRALGEHHGERDRHFALREPWQGKCVRLGPASASLGPLFASDTRLLHLQLVHLAGCLPATTDMTVEARRFNHLHRQSLERLYEFAAAPLHLNRRVEPHWQRLRNTSPPHGLDLRIEQFRSRGRLPTFDGEVVDRQSWIDLFVSLGIVPERHDRRADGFDPRQLDRALGTIRAQLDQMLARMPNYDHYMQRLSDK